MSAVTSDPRPRREFVLVPSRDEVADAGFTLVLGGLALIGFRTTYSSDQYLVVGLIGIVLGLLLAHLAIVLRQPAIVVAALGVAAFFLLGGAIALRSTPGSSSLPSGGTLHSLATTSVHGWKDLLTTLPPVDGTGPLLVLPYLLGLFAGLGGLTLARRTRPSFAPVFAPLAVLVAVILLGIHTPSAKLWQGAVFAATALAWASIRALRAGAPLRNGSGRSTRAITGLLLLAVAAAAAFTVGPHLPGSGGKRTVLRSYVVPPHNVGDYPSPLTEFRDYTDWKAGTQYDQVLFRVGGDLPKGTPIEFATLSDYNGSVWTAAPSGDAGPADQYFQKVGSTIDNPAAGPSYSMTVSVQDYTDYWLPDAGSIQGVHFDGTDSTTDSANFRYDVQTSTGVVTTRLARGDQYTLRVGGVTSEPLTATTDLLTGSSNGEGDFLKSSGDSLIGKAGSTARQILALAANLKAQGSYSDGDKSAPYYLPGQSIGRLDSFVQGVVPGVHYVGDDEQFAAALALMIDEEGVPARVVVGVPSLPANRVVLGKDVRAWVEVERGDGTWATIPTTAFVSTRPPRKHSIVEPKPKSGQIVPPPAQGHLHSTLDEAAQSNGRSKAVHHPTPKTGAGFSLPGWLVTTATDVGIPLLALLLLAGAIVGAKTLRRRRRRGRGGPVQRLVRGWHELLDHARDLGSAAPSLSTRREQGTALSDFGLDHVARMADAHVFGSADPSEADAAAFWREVDQARRQMSGRVGFWRRRLAAVNLASLMGNRTVRGAS